MNHLSPKDLVCTVVGFALSWYFFPPGFIALLFPNNTHMSEHLVWTAAVLVCVGACAAAAMALRDRVEGLLDHRRFLVLAFLETVSVLGYVLLSIAHLLPEPWAVVALAASVPLVAGGYTVLIFAWAFTMARVESSQAISTVMAAILLYAALSLLGLGTASTGVVANALVPCASGALWFVARPGATKTESAQVSACKPVSILRELPWLQIGLVALFLVGGRVIIGLFFDYSLETRQTELLLRNVLIGLAMAFMLVRLRHAPDPTRQIRASWTPIAVIFFCGTLLQIALGSQANVLGCGVINAMLCCFECIVYLVLLQFVQEKGASPVLVFGLWLAVLKALPLFIQRCPSALLSKQFNLSGETLALSVAFVAMAIIAGMLAFTARRTTTDSTPQTFPTAAPNSTKGAFDKLCASAGLTPREHEIAVLITEGNSQKKIAELLGLSYNTVQSYTKGIYPKMGVHSKQELVDLAAEPGRRPA